MRSTRSALAAAFLLSASAAAWGQSGNGLYAEYYNTNNFTGGTVHTDTNTGPIDFDYGAGTPHANVTNVDGFSTRWRAQIEGPVTDTVTFSLQTTDVARLFINNTQVISASNNTATAAVPMVAGQRYDVLVEHVETAGNAFIRLSWSWPAAPSIVVVPKNRFHSPTADIVPAAVVIAPNGGEATPPLLVDLSGPVAGAIYYTLDGSDPGTNSPLSNPQAHLYTVPFQVSSYVRINARAYNLGVPGPLTTSNQFSPRYPVFSPIPSTGGGLYRRMYFHGGGLGNAMPIWENSIPEQRRIETNPFNGVNSTTDTTSAIGNRSGRNDNFAMRFTGYIDMPEAGLWTFRLRSDDDARLFIDGVLVSHSTSTNVDTDGQIALATGLHQITIDYYEGTGSQNFTLSYQGPTVAMAQIPANRFYTELISPTPTLDASNTITFNGSQNIILNIPGGSGTIYYTTDGTPPDPRSATGSGSSGLSIPISATTRIRAIAVQSAAHPSALYDQTFTRNDPPPGSPFASVLAAGVTTQVEVNFNRTVVGGAETAGNYTITGGANPAVNAAVRAPRNTDLRAWWKLDDSGTTADDAGTNNVDGTHVNTPTPDGADKATLDFTNDRSLGFQAADSDYVTVPHNAALDLGTRDFTIALWVNPVGTSEYPLINKWNQATPKGWSIDVNAGAAGNIRFRMHDGTNDESHSVAGGVAAGVWQHIAVRFDRASLRMSVFRNGGLVGTVRDMNLAFTNVDTTAALELGRLVAAATTQLDGKLDDVRIYGVALSDAEILGLFNGAEDPSTRVLLTTGSALTAAQTYTLAVSGLTDATAAAVSGSINFAYRTGRLTHEQFNGGANTAVTDLTRNAIYPNSPTNRTTVTSGTIDLDLDAYGGRLRGYFIPDQTGKWRFAIASDDNGQLWLSTDSDPARKVLVSTCTPWTNALQFGQPEVTQSAPIILTAGQRYYLEALYKENNGGDHCTIAAKYVQADDTVMIANNEPSIAAALIAPYLLPATITTQPVSREIQAGGTVSFTVAATGNTDGFTYQWKFNGSNITNGGRFAGATSTTLTITGAIDPTDEGTYTVDVTHQGGTLTSLPATLVLRPVVAPNVTSVDPVSGPIWGGGPVKVIGTDFLFSQTAASIGGTALTNLIYFPDGQMILAFLPARSTGGAVDVVGSHLGLSDTLAGGFTYYAPPVVTSLSASAGTDDGGETVTIFGSNFLPGPTTVKFGSLDATNVNVALDGLSLTCTVPGPGTGTVHVTVINSILPGAKLNAYTYYPDPTIDMVTPSFGTDAGGQAVTITGTGFAPNQSVTFGGTAATNVNVAADGMSLTCTTPQRLGVVSSEDVDVAVNGPGGPATLNAGYTYYADPVIGTITPNNGPDGGSQAVTITGTGFSPDATVSFGGNPATGIVVAVDGLSLQCVTPLRNGVTTSQAVDVVVTAAGGSDTEVGGYTYWADPTFGTLSTPLGIPDGPQVGNQTVTITGGTNFVSGQTTVTFGANTPVNATVGGGGTSLTVQTPANAFAAGTVNVTITTPGGSVTQNAAYTYHDAPSISDINPTSGRTAGGEPVQITGSNFPDLKTSVDVDGTLVANVAAGTTVDFDTPAHSAGAVTVTVTTPGGSDTISFNYNAGPFVSLINPNVGPAVGGQSVTITGTGLSGTTQVTVGGATATIVGTPTATAVSITTPGGTPGAPVDVVVTTADDSFTVVGGYTYTGTPTVATVTPNQGPVGGGQSVTITGSDFASSADTAVTFDGAPATSVNVTNTNTLTCVTPLGSAGPANIVVTTYGTQASAPASLYTYVDPPVLSTMAPRRGPDAGGQVVSITGNNFVPGFTEVLFNGVPVTPTTITATTMTLSTPPGTVGTVNVVVRTFQPPGQSSSALSYTYVDDATSVDLRLSKTVDNSVAGVGENVVFTIIVTNDGAVAGTNVVVTDLLPAALTYVSHTATAGTYTPGNGAWTIPNLASGGANATLTITATVNSSVSVTNVAEVTSVTEEDVDSVPGNGSTTEDDRATASVDAGLTIQTPDPLPEGTVRAYYSVGLAATGGTSPYTWTLLTAPATLPFNLDAATGVISGFAPDVATDYTFDIQVSDGGATPQTSTRTFTITINAADAGPPVVNASPAAPDGVVGVLYSHTFTATGGAPPYTWDVPVGTLPAGLILNPFTGELVGVPTTAVVGASFSVRATPASGAASSNFAVMIDIAANPVAFVTAAALPNGTIGAQYTHYIEISGGVGPFAYAVTVPPTGWTVTPTPMGRFVRVSGTPFGAAGPDGFTLQVTDNGQAGVTATRAFTLTKLAAGGAITVSSPPGAFPVGTVDRSYSVLLSANGGTPPYFWTLIGGSLPPGLTLNGGASTISGIPTSAGTFQFTVQADQFGGGAVPGTAVLTIEIVPAPMLTTPLTLPAGVEGEGYFAEITFAGGVEPVTWTNPGGGLPPGIALNGAAGVLSGILSAGSSGTYTFTLTGTDINGATVTDSFTIDIADPAALVAVSTSLPRGTVGVPYSGTLFAAGGSTPYSWAPLTGTPPAWATLDALTGTIRGTPTAAGTTNLSFRVTDNALATADTIVLALVVDGPFSITTASLPAAKQSGSYNRTLASTGGVSPLLWSLASGSLPAGLGLSPAGVISGTLTSTAVTAVFQVQVVDSLGRTASRTYTIVVNPASGGGGGGGGGGGCGSSIGLGSIPWGALASLAGLLALAARRRR